MTGYSNGHPFYPRRPVPEVLVEFQAWLSEVEGYDGKKALVTVKNVCYVLERNKENPYDYLESIVDRASAQWIVLLLDATRLLFKWLLTRDQHTADEDLVWAREQMRLLEGLAKTVQGKRPPSMGSPLPLTEEGAQAALELVQRPHPKYPWAGLLLPTYLLTAITPIHLLRLRSTDVRDLIDRWKDGKPVWVGIHQRPGGRTRGEGGRKHLYPAMWALPYLVKTLEWPMEWFSLSQIVCPARTKTGRSAWAAAEEAWKEGLHNGRPPGVMRKALLEILGGPLKVITWTALHAIVVRTMQARILRELGDWATATQIGTGCGGIGKLKNKAWAREAYLGPDQSSVWAPVLGRGGRDGK